MSVSIAIEQFGDLVGLPELGRKSTESCSLVIDERWPVSLERRVNGGLAISVTVGPLPLEERERIAVELLEANRHLVEDGVAFAVNAVTDEIMLQTSRDSPGLQGTDVLAAVTRLINHAEHWTAANIAEENASKH